MTITANMTREHAEAKLLDSYRRGMLSHAYVFSGPMGAGKMDTAMSLAQALLCTAEPNSDRAGGCGKCVQCRRVANGNHPNVTRIAPDGTVIKIDQIRELQRGFAYRSDDYQPRIYIIEQADKMTPQAANSILKFLEEPGESIIAILITDNSSALLPTILSRVQRIPFAPLSPDDIAKQLLAEGFAEQDVYLAAHVAGSIDKARQYLGTNVFAESRNVVIQLAKECLASQTGSEALLTAHQRIFFKSDLSDQLELILQLFAFLFKDIINIQTMRETQALFPEHLDWIKQAGLRRDSLLWVGALEHVMEAQRKLRARVNPQLVMERFLIALMGV